MTPTTYNHLPAALRQPIQLTNVSTACF